MASYFLTPQQHVSQCTLPQKLTKTKLKGCPAKKQKKENKTKSKWGPTNKQKKMVCTNFLLHYWIVGKVVEQFCDDFTCKLVQNKLDRFSNTNNQVFLFII